MGHEIYRTDLSFKFEGKTFCEIAQIIYNEYNGIIFGKALVIKSLGDLGGQEYYNSVESWAILGD